MSDRTEKGKRRAQETEIFFDGLQQSKSSNGTEQHKIPKRTLQLRTPPVARHYVYEWPTVVATAAVAATPPPPLRRPPPRWGPDPRRCAPSTREHMTFCSKSKRFDPTERKPTNRNCWCWEQPKCTNVPWGGGASGTEPQPDWWLGAVVHTDGATWCNQWSVGTGKCACSPPIDAVFGKMCNTCGTCHTRK